MDCRLGVGLLSQIFLHHNKLEQFPNPSSNHQWVKHQQTWTPLAVHTLLSGEETVSFLFFSGWEQWSHAASKMQIKGHCLKTHTKHEIICKKQRSNIEGPNLMPSCQWQLHCWDSVHLISEFSLIITQKAYAHSTHCVLITKWYTQNKSVCCGRGL